MERATAKMILNGVYGRLGMKPDQDIIEIVNSSKAEEILSKFNVKEQYNLTENLEFIRYANTPIAGFLELFGKLIRQNGDRTLLLTNEISVQTVTLNCLNIIKLI
jgi:hypothetical protein